jgi:hypothetical protein
MWVGGERGREFAVEREREEFAGVEEAGVRGGSMAG